MQSKSNVPPSRIDATMYLERVELERGRHLVGLQRLLHILLVGEHQEACEFELVLLHDCVQLALDLAHAFAIARIDHENHTRCARVVVPPEWPQFVLPAHVLGEVREDEMRGEDEVRRCACMRARY